MLDFKRDASSFIKINSIRSFQMGSQAQNEDSFHSFASALVSRLREMPNLAVLCPQCDTSHTTSIVELALLVARQFQAFQTGHHSSTGPEASAPDSNVNAPAPPSNGQCRTTEEPTSCEEVGGENSNGPATERMFEVKRKSRNGEVIQLTRAVVSPLFGLHLPNAAEELGISKTSLKKGCRFLGLHRWPGRKVRGLVNIIVGLERTLVSQGADSGNVENAGMRSKLQQELDELRHGTLAKITAKMRSPAAAITRNAYRRLYYARVRGSKHLKRGRRDIKTGSQANLTSGLAPASAGGNSSEANEVAQAMQNPAPCTDVDPPANQPSEPTPNADKESPRPSPRKFVRPRPRRNLRSSSRLGSRDAEMKASDLEGLLPEVQDTVNVAGAGREVPESVAIVQAQNGNNMPTPKTEIGEEGAEDEGATVGELRSAKRPKTEPLCGNCENIKSLQGNDCAPALATGEGSMAAVTKSGF